MADIKGFLKELEFGVAAFQDLRPKRVLSISHNDGDGLTASALICKTMDFLKIPRVQVIFERSMSWDDYFKLLMQRFGNIDTIFLSDLGAEEKQISGIFNEATGIEVFILDHHKVSKKEHLDEYPGNFHSMNPTRFGLDGLKEIAGSTLTYLFCEELSQRVKKLSWLPVVGMAGDVLDNPKDYRSYNQSVLNVALEEGVVKFNDGLALLGGMHEKRLADSLAHSILPFIPEIKGDPLVATRILEKNGIDPNQSVMGLTESDKDALVSLFGNDIIGKTVLLENRKGLLRHSFEFNFLIGIVGDENFQGALDTLDQKGSNKKDLGIYNDYMKQLVHNLANISGKSLQEGGLYKFYEIKDEGTKQMVSDTASFTSVNNLLSNEIMLILGTEESPGKFKLSLRCSPHFVQLHEKGVGDVIESLVGEFGGRGGGHDLAGGWLMSGEEFKEFTSNLQKIDQIIKENKNEHRITEN